MENRENWPTEPGVLPGELAGQGASVTGEVARRKSAYYLPIFLVAGLIILAVILFVGKPTDAKEYIRSSGYAGVFLLALIGSTSPIWPLPGSFAAFIAGGLGLNPALLALAAATGETIGESTAYLAGYGGQGPIQGTIVKWKRYKQVEGWTARHGGWTIFAVSAVPNTFTKFVTVAAGALRYPLKRFICVCWSGKLIKSAGFALAGAGLFDALMNLF